jgi:hypothetical protein
MSVNPWQAEGVSILPFDLKDLMPIVGQQELFRSLDGFREETLKKGRDALSGFFVLIGGWGVGKSRVGHELCLEGVANEAEWIVEGRPERVLKAGLEQNILPIFVRYSQVTTGPLGSTLETDNWIPSVAAEALSRLVGIRDNHKVNKLTKNQDRLLELTRQALAPRGWQSVHRRLVEALAASQPEVAVRQSLEVLKDLKIENLWIVVDEIEDITDTERDGLPSDDRGEGIDQALLTVIPRVIKQEELRQEFPQINFILLCSLAVGDLMRGIPAIRRRTSWHELNTNSFNDVEAFFRYLRDHRPLVASSISTYPEGLKEAAFFAANRNFGWFNVIMNHAHENHRDGSIPVPDLLRKFAQDKPKGLKNTVFDLEAISDYQIVRDADKDEVVRLIFGLLPKPVGSEAGQMPEATARRFFEKRHDVSGKKLFTPVVEVCPPLPHLITAHMVSSGFRNPEGNILELPGEARFNIQTVMDSLRAYSIGLPQDRRENLLVSEMEEEFTEQVRSLSPYASEAEIFAPRLHRFLMLAWKETKDKGSAGQLFLAPSFSFLRGFNRLNKLREAESGYLRDGRKNTQLEEAYQALSSDKQKSARALLRGISFAWEKESVELDFPTGFRQVCANITSQQPPLNLGTDSAVTLLIAQSAEEVELKDDLNRIAREPKRPVVIVVRNNPDLAEQLPERIARIAPEISPMVIVHNLLPQEQEVLQRLGLIAGNFNPDELRTRYFSGWIETARQNLFQQVNNWSENVERRGLVLRPIFHGRSTKDHELQVLARGYVAMVNGSSYDVLLRSPLFDPTELDFFKKAVDRHLNPGPKFDGFPTAGLVIDESGSRVPRIPRALIALVERCGSIALSRTDLERSFLYETHPDTPARDVIRQLTLFLLHVGLLETQGDKGDKYVRVTTKSLEDLLKRAEDWLGREFAQVSSEIQAIHREVGDRLQDQLSKEARQKLKDAHKKLDALNLDFFKLGWDELNKLGSDGEPLYVGRITTAMRIIAEIRASVASVFEAQPAKDFSYSPDSLSEYEAQSGKSDYPLWRRVAILRGFYRDLRDRRQVLLDRIQAVVKEVEARVPMNSAGERIFPTQALSLPLEFYRKELNFPSDKPGQTINVGATTLGIATVGFKLASNRFREAVDRLNAIDAELNQPGKLVTSFLSSLKEWEGVRLETNGLRNRVVELKQFFSDADQSTKERFQIAEVDRQFSDLQGLAEEGLMRQKTDQRDAAGISIFDLTSKLSADVEEVKPLLGALRSLLDGINNGVLVKLQEDYRTKHSSLMSAFRRVRRAENRDEVAWPDKKGPTWGQTVLLFNQVVEQAEREGNAYLPPEGTTTFSDLIAISRMDELGKEVDWNVAPYEGHVKTLVDKKLLRLRLI